MPEISTSVFYHTGRIRHAPAQVGSIADRKEHTSELQSRENLVCRLLLEKKKNDAFYHIY